MAEHFGARKVEDVRRKGAYVPRNRGRNQEMSRICGSARERDGGDADELAIGREGGLVDGRRIDADRGALAEEIFNQTVERLVGSIADIVVVAAEEGNAKVGRVHPRSVSASPTKGQWTGGPACHGR